MQQEKIPYHAQERSIRRGNGKTFFSSILHDREPGIINDTDCCMCVCVKIKDANVKFLRDIETLCMHDI